MNASNYLWQSTVTVHMVFTGNLDIDKRWYNAPTLRTEVAALLEKAGNHPEIETRIYPTSDCCRSISPLNENGDAVVYLLLFLCGEGGWYEELQHIEERRTRKHVGLTQLQFFACRLVLRPGFSLIHSSGTLFQKYILVAYVKTEESRLNCVPLSGRSASGNILWTVWCSKSKSREPHLIISALDTATLKGLWSNKL
jgi:hypothetical protein